MKYIMRVEELKDKLENDAAHTVVIDTRFDMSQPEWGKDMYDKLHIESAFYLDLEKDLAGEPKKHGGRNPFPDVDVLAKKLGEIGVDHDKTVVFYDQGEGMFAARAWFLLHYMGHPKVYVLDGGFKAWMAGGNPITNEPPEATPTTFKPKVNEDLVVHMQDVKEKTNSKDAILIDARSKDRYLGKGEALDARAGHIPGAKSFFWKNVLDDNGKWKAIDKLEENFSKLPKEEEIIVSCGSGISACPNVMALKMLGYENVKLYPGSFSDWISYEDNKLETKEE